MEGHYSKCLLRSTLAGMCIGIGGCVYIGCEVKWVGAILFAIGLFTILTYKLDLYTGKVGYAVDNPPSYIVDLLVIIVGNFIGTLILGIMMPLSGAEVLVEDDHVWIGDHPLFAPEEPLDAHGDHRVAMALSVLLTKYGGQLDGEASVGKSFPEFFDVLRALGVRIEDAPPIELPALPEGVEP